ncbi:hypothetical protein T265_06545, partial [Opisthorchis viverrini]
APNIKQKSELQACSRTGVFRNELCRSLHSIGQNEAARVKNPQTASEDSHILSAQSEAGDLCRQKWEYSSRQRLTSRFGETQQHHVRTSSATM